MDIVEKLEGIKSDSLASLKDIAQAETEIGFSFPPVLKEIYLKISNGGIGPGYKILGVNGGHTSNEGDSISKLYTIFSSADTDDPSWQWPVGLVPFCDWGCAIYSCFDATKDNYPVVWFDPHLREVGEPMEQHFLPHKNSLDEWLASWLNGNDLWAETYGS